MSVVITTPAQAYALVKVARLRPELDGSQGENRAIGRAQIAANTDWEAIQLWLRQYENIRTYQSYEKEVTRFYVWVLATRRKPFSSVLYEDWESYYEFMADPQPAAEWVSARRSSRTAVEYRPFSAPLNDTSRGYARTVLWTLFEWLRSVGYLAGNPIIVQRRRRGAPQQRPTRYLTAALWQAVVNSVEAYPRTTVSERNRYHLSRWLVSLFYLTGIRTSEAVGARMSDIFTIRDPEDGGLRHFFFVTGKGGKRRAVPVTTDLAEELQQYREAFELSPWPASSEDIPLVFSLHTKKRYKPLKRQALYLALKCIFTRAAKDLAEADREGAKTLEAASTHWLRHTAASNMLDQGVSLLATRDMLGHANISTTSIYSHAEILQLHRELSQHHLLRWKE